jgi:hypothetical protein
VIQRGYRALVLWIVWAAASLIVVLGLYNDTGVWEFVQSDASHITWVIIGFFLLGVLISFALMLLVTFESVHVDRLQTIARSSGWCGIEHTPKRLGLAKFFDSLRTVIGTNSEVDIESLVDVEFAPYQRVAQALEVFGNLMITFGLIGTVVGLSLTLSGLTTSLQALGEDQEQLLSGLRSAMEGMGTAFYATLLGAVFGGVLLRVFAHINQNGVESLEDSLQRIFLVYCAADIKPSPQRDIRLLDSEIQAITRNLERLHATLNDTRHMVADFAKELVQLRKIESDEATMRATLDAQREYLGTLRTEFQLKRMNKRRWWSVFRHSFHKES